MDARPWEDYTPLEYIRSMSELEKIIETSHICIENMFKKIIKRHTFNAFKSRILDAFNDFVKV